MTSIRRHRVRRTPLGRRRALSLGAAALLLLAVAATLALALAPRPGPSRDRPELAANTAAAGDVIWKPAPSTRAAGRGGAALAGGRVRVVSPKGSDAAPGTVRRPLRTIASALRRAR